MSLCHLSGILLNFNDFIRFMHMLMTLIYSLGHWLNGMFLVESLDQSCHV